MKKCLLAVFLAATVVFTGCVSEKSEGQQKETEELVVEDDHSDDGVQKVGISMPASTLERWNHDGFFLKKHLEEEGYKVELLFSQNLIDSQIENIDQLIEDKCDLLIIAAVDGKSLTGVMRRAAEHDIPVVAYDRLICDSPYVTAYVSYDNYRVGQLQGEYARDTLDLDHAGKRKFRLEFVSGDSADNNARYFFNGAHDVLGPYIRSGVVEIASGQKDFYTTSTAQWESDVAKNRMEILLGSYYDSVTRLDAVICSNDSTARGVIEALNDSYGKDNKVLVTGQDCDVANLDYIMQGLQSMSVYKDLNQEAMVAVGLTNAIMEGKTIDQNLEATIGYGVRYDTTSYDNGVVMVKSFLLEPETVTASNAEEILVDKYGSYTYGALGFQRVAE